MKPVTLQTKRLVLRPWRIEDLTPLTRLYADSRVMEYWEVQSFEATVKEYHHFVSSIQRQGWGFWAVELQKSHTFIGLIGLAESALQAHMAHFAPAVEIGWRLHYDFWGKGYATEGAQAALHFGFETLKLNEIVSFAAVGNERSRRVMERLGMTYNPQDDFNDPDLPVGHPIRQQVVYRLKRQKWKIHHQQTIHSSLKAVPPL